MDIFKYESYKAYVLDRVQAMPRSGHGQFKKIADHLQVSPVIVTQVLKGPRQFTDEQGLKLSDYLGLNSDATEFMMRLLAHEKAGTRDLRLYHQKALRELKRRATEVKNRVAEFRELDDTAKSIFYSDWIYSAIRLLTSIPRFKTADAMAESLGLGRAQVNEILEFLVSVGLCKADAHGGFE